MATNTRALGTTLAHLRRMGRLEKVDTALVQALRSMAGALDLDPSNAALWRQYREALGGLTADDSNGSVDKALEDLYGTVRDAASAGAGVVRP